MEISRRDLFTRAGRMAAGAVALQVPAALYRSPWLERAAAQTVPGVHATFTALVEAVTGDADAATGAWIAKEFDKALPPLPNGTPSAAVAAVLDARTLAAGAGPSFAATTVQNRRRVLEGMVKDPSPDIRQIANQVLPFSGYAYWSDATLPGPATAGGARLRRWDEIGFPGPSHDLRHSYRRGSPPGFRPMQDFER